MINFKVLNLVHLFQQLRDNYKKQKQNNNNGKMQVKSSKRVSLLCFTFIRKNVLNPSYKWFLARELSGRILHIKEKLIIGKEVIIINLY